ncbi:MAG: imidazolonepropionase [Phycisphaerales bacterium]|nr:MAG: imidazolonepropionase [Phycisphaerales bacterium]
MSEGVLVQNARVLTLAGETPRRGAALAELGVREACDVLVREGRIERVEPEIPQATDVRTIDARGRVLMPGFVDCHTHACWAGERLDEWEQKQRGASYLEILERGGGIMSTVRAVRAASEDELVERLLERLAWMLRDGTCTVEVKSGYGLETEAELKMLRAIARAGEAWAGTVVPTACIGHAIDPHAGDSNVFVESTIAETLPAVHELFPGVAIDAYCEQGAWSLADTVRLFERAQELGHPVRVHADQFHALGMVEEAIRLGAVSVDHLEATGDESLRRLAVSDTFGVMLPCAGFHLDGRYADGRAFVDAGGKLAIATNVNPGSAPCASVPMAVALGVRHLGLTAGEAIAGVTTNAAALLGFRDRGRIEPGLRADLVLLRHRDERQLAFEFGGSPVDLVVCNGRIVFGGGAG